MAYSWHILLHFRRTTNAHSSTSSRLALNIKQSPACSLATLALIRKIDMWSVWDHHRHDEFVMSSPIENAIALIALTYRLAAEIKFSWYLFLLNQARI